MVSFLSGLEATTTGRRLPVTVNSGAQGLFELGCLDSMLQGPCRRRRSELVEAFLGDRLFEVSALWRRLDYPLLVLHISRANHLVLAQRSCVECLL